MSYKVFIVPGVQRRIRDQAEYIAVEQGAPETAGKWLARIYHRIDDLGEMPRRFSLAAEDALLVDLADLQADDAFEGEDA
ncbi:MAG: hypothetical protein IT349_08570 [Candidatus Eisenbacteria bacterium]|nr:hypothetical protein [Candidatus Eisenbacteria bacterium]MCC7142138.1 hypothetical protein [Candidatus Eisenbacteria bacterium]